MKVAITGASGHVGHCLCRQLVEQGVKIKALIHRNKNQLAEMGAETIHGNVIEKQSLIELFTGADVVFHLAARISIDNKHTQHVFETNVTGTKNVIDVCMAVGVKKLVHFSTIHTIHSFGPEKPMDETNPLIASSNIAYETSKAEAEKLVMKAASDWLDAVILHPTAVIGPYDFQPSYLGQALIKIYKNQLPMLVPGGYDFVDVRDVAMAAIAASTKGRRGERYILSGEWMSLKELSLEIRKISNQKTPTFLAPTWLAHAGLPFIHGWAKLTGQHPLYTSESLEILKSSCRNISNQKARTELGFQPRPVGETLKDTFAWFKQNNLA